MCIQICVSDGYLEIVRGMCVSFCLGLNVLLSMMGVGIILTLLCMYRGGRCEYWFL